ncbi:MAG: ATP-binding protein [bacterium]|nr:ATP-binding protein [bacterium]
MEKLNLTLNSNRSEIQKFEEFLESVNSKFNLSAERFINLQIASSEAVVNAIVHGNNEDASKKVYVEIQFDDKSMLIKIRDEGKGFDLQTLPDPTSNENILKESGRGIFIIRSLVDDFHCNSTDSGTEFVLVVNKT